MMITIYKYDGQNIYSGTVEVNPDDSVPSGLLDAPPELTGAQVAQAVNGKWVILPSRPIPSTPSQFELDQVRYTKRAAVKDSLLAYMAADNMSRVRSGAWTVTDLTNLLADPAVSAANQFMSTLSFELAAQAIAQAATPLLTPAIRTDWITRLQAHFYLEG